MPEVIDQARAVLANPSARRYLCRRWAEELPAPESPVFALLLALLNLASEMSEREKRELDITWPEAQAALAAFVEACGGQIIENSPCVVRTNSL